MVPVTLAQVSPAVIIPESETRPVRKNGCPGTQLLHTQIQRELKELTVLRGGQVLFDELGRQLRPRLTPSALTEDSQSEIVAHRPPSPICFCSIASFRVPRCSNGHRVGEVGSFALLLNSVA
jgi:hypothetical protein